MHQYMLRNGKPFPMQKLTVIKGSIPKSIQGSYFKNGPGLLTIGEDVLPHWFIGAAGLLKVQFHNGNAYAQYKFLQTPAYKRDIQSKTLTRPNFVVQKIKSIFGSKFDESVYNAASTNILRFPNSEKLFALFEGGLPYQLEEKTINEHGFKDLGFIEKAYSAHPKVDPDNGDIFNIGFNGDSFNVYRISKDLKLIAKNTVKQRIPQSIHDCCLAGDYLVVFENPLKINLCSILKGDNFLKWFAVDYNYGKTIVYILKKENLEFVKKIQLQTPQTFIMYHFTNGYSENNKIFVQYAKYAGQNAQKFLEFVAYAPHYALNDGKPKNKYNLESQLETLQIKLDDFSYKFKSKNIDCEFPICQDSSVGKKWQYSYFITKDKGEQFVNFDKLGRYDRFNDKIDIRQFPGCCIVEPTLIHTKDGLFILILKSSPQRCSIQILQGEKFETVAQIQIPEYIPFGFHGKWVDTEDKESLSTANWVN